MRKPTFEQGCTPHDHTCASIPKRRDHRRRTWLLNRPVQAQEVGPEQVGGPNAAEAARKPAVRPPTPPARRLCGQPGMSQRRSSSKRRCASVEQVCPVQHPPVEAEPSGAWGGSVAGAPRYCSPRWCTTRRRCGSGARLSTLSCRSSSRPAPRCRCRSSGWSAQPDRPAASGLPAPGHRPHPPGQRPRRRHELRQHPTGEEAVF